MARNPFTPTFGVTPPLLVGRDDVIDEFTAALDDGPGSSGRATVYTGARGTGKTVMLNEVEERARQRGWFTISETATVGFVDRIVGEHLPALLAEYDEEAVRRHLTGVAGPLNIGGLTWDAEDRHAAAPGLRTRVALVAKLLSDRGGGGLLFTLDEIPPKPTEEMRHFFAEIQHAFRAELEVAFAGAALPNAVDEMLAADQLTFLRRADHQELGAVALADVARAIHEPIVANGRDIGEAALARAAEATEGYPFLIQLVGQQIWRQRPGEAVITIDDVEAGAQDAQRRLGRLVHAPALKGLSGVDRTFLVAMAEDDGPSRMGEVASRMGVTPVYAGQYRLRLIRQGMISEASRGHVDFALPFLRDYLRSHAVADVARGQRPSPASPPADPSPRP